MYNMIMLKNKFISFLLFAIVTYSASFIGSIATISYKEPWYSGLNKSFLTPPDWVFAPVWTTLYLFMTIAIWAAWHKNYKNINLLTDNKKLPLPNIKNLRKWINKDKKAS